MYKHNFLYNLTLFHGRYNSLFIIVFYVGLYTIYMNLKCSDCIFVLFPDLFDAYNVGYCVNLNLK
jgi:hypothetical protein